MRKFALLAAVLFTALSLADEKGEKKPKDQDAILGAWKVEKLEYGREVEPTAEEVAKEGKVYTFDKGGKAIESWNTDEEKMEVNLKFTLDPARTPKTFFFERGKQVMFGIYELDGDTLKLCVASGKPVRPTELKAVEGETTLITLKRVKDDKKDGKKDK